MCGKGFVIQERRRAPAVAKDLERHRTRFILAQEFDPALAERLDARGIRVVADDVRALVDDEGAAFVVETNSGARHPLDALFVAATPRRDLDYQSGLALALADAAGERLASDASGAPNVSPPV